MLTWSWKCTMARFFWGLQYTLSTFPKCPKCCMMRSFLLRLGGMPLHCITVASVGERPPKLSVLSFREARLPGVYVCAWGLNATKTSDHNLKNVSKKNSQNKKLGILQTHIIDFYLIYIYIFLHYDSVDIEYLMKHDFSNNFFILRLYLLSQHTHKIIFKNTNN